MKLLTTTVPAGNSRGPAPLPIFGAGTISDEIDPTTLAAILLSRRFGLQINRARLLATLASLGGHQ